MPPESAVRSAAVSRKRNRGRRRRAVRRDRRGRSRTPSRSRSATRRSTYARLDAPGQSRSRQSCCASLPIARSRLRSCSITAAVASPASSACSRPGARIARSVPRIRRDQQRETLADLQAALLLCAPSLVELAQTYTLPRICVVSRSIRRRWQGTEPEVPVHADCADDIAAVYYTSGTTGKAKGAMLSHRYLLHRAWVSAPDHGVAPGDRISQIAEISVATAATDVFVALLAGATLCPFDARQEEPAPTGNSVAESRPHCDRAHGGRTVPSAPRFARRHRPISARPLHTTVRASCIWNSVDRYRRHFPRECRLVRQLAATETSLVATMMVDHDTPRRGARCRSAIRFPARKCGWRARGRQARRQDRRVGEIVIRSRYL